MGISKFDSKALPSLLYFVIPNTHICCFILAISIEFSEQVILNLSKHLIITHLSIYLILIEKFKPWKTISYVLQVYAIGNKN